MIQKNQAAGETQYLTDDSGSFKTLVAALFTGLVFWSSLFALLFFCLVS